PTRSFFFPHPHPLRAPHSFPTRRSSDLSHPARRRGALRCAPHARAGVLGSLTLTHRGSVTHRSTVTRRDAVIRRDARAARRMTRSEEHTSELQSRFDLVCRLLLEKKK